MYLFFLKLYVSIFFYWIKLVETRFCCCKNSFKGTFWCEKGRVLDGIRLQQRSSADGWRAAGVFNGMERSIKSSVVSQLCNRYPPKLCAYEARLWTSTRSWGSVWVFGLTMGLKGFMGIPYGKEFKSLLLGYSGICYFLYVQREF